MSKITSRQTLLGLAAVVVLLLSESCAKYHGAVSVVNQSADSISKVVVVVSNQTFQMDGLAPGETRTVSYLVHGDSDYAVTAELKSGRRLEQKVGYVTRGFEYQDEIIIADNEIRMGKRSVMSR